MADAHPAISIANKTPAIRPPSAPPSLPSSRPPARPPAATSARPPSERRLSTISTRVCWKYRRSSARAPPRRRYVSKRYARKSLGGGRYVSKRHPRYVSKRYSRKSLGGGRYVSKRSARKSLGEAGMLARGLLDRAPCKRGRLHPVRETDYCSSSLARIPECHSYRRLLGVSKRVNSRKEPRGAPKQPSDVT